MFRQTALRPVTALTLWLLCGAGIARAAAPEVDDKAGFFSEGALRQANQLIGHTYKSTTPHKDIVVETVPQVPGGENADQYATARFSRRTVDGLQVLIVKKPHKVAVSVGRSTQERFGRSQAEEMRRLMISRFRARDFDGGLLEALRYADRELTSAYPYMASTRVPGYASQPPPRALPPMVPAYSRPQHQGTGFWGTLFWIIAIGFVIWVVIALVRAIAGAARGATSMSNYGPPPGGMGMGSGMGMGMGQGPTYYPPAYPGGGGGFGRSLLGGMLGGVAGGWIYDRLFRSDEPHYHGGDAGYSGGGYAGGADYREPAAPPSDEGQVGFTVGGSGGGDDWSGGGDSGGGDYGGGGDSGGGDSGGGGDW